MRLDAFSHSVSHPTDSSGPHGDNCAVDHSSFSGSQIAGTGQGHPKWAMIIVPSFGAESASRQAEQDASGQPLPAFFFAAGRGFDDCFLAGIVLGRCVVWVPELGVRQTDVNLNIIAEVFAFFFQSCETGKEIAASLRPFGVDG